MLDATSQDVESDLQIRLDDQSLVNDVTVTGVDGVVARATSPTSIAAYGVYRDDVVSLTDLDNELWDRANYEIAANAEPAPRVPTVTVSLINCSSTKITNLITLGLGDVVQLTTLPAQAPAASMLFYVEGYTETLGPSDWSMTFNLSPYNPIGSVWQLDSATYSVLDSTTTLAY